MLKGAGTYPGSDATTPEVAFWNEFGTEDIPPRPFLLPTLRKNRAKYSKLMALAVKNALTNGAPLDLTLLGVEAAADVQDAIYQLQDPENAESTKKKKRRTGDPNGAVKPLIDTGRLVQSIKFAVE